MHPTPQMLLRLIVCHALLIILSGCTLKASTESLTDATTNFLSSTTPGAWFNEDGLIRPDQRLNVFVAINYETLQQEMAQGEGEYLTALGTLLEIPDEKMPSFKIWTQAQFRMIQTTADPTPQTLLAVLSDMNSGPGMTTQHF